MSAASARKFRIDLAAEIKRAKVKPDVLTRKVVLDVLTRVVMRTPVGTRELWAINSPELRAWRAAHGLSELRPEGYIGGRARGNWQYGALTGGVGVPQQPLDVIDPEGRASIDREAAKIPAEAANMVHVLINHLPYMQALEDGHSKQAPEGIVGLTVLEFGGIVQTRAQEVSTTDDPR
jgi:hypothetical protein